MAKYQVAFYREEGETNKEVEYLVHGEVTAFVRGRSYGDPEDCFPDEGGDAEITKILDIFGEEVDQSNFTTEELNYMVVTLQEAAFEDDSGDEEYDDED